MTEAVALLLDSDTTTPPVGASPLSVTVPVEVFPPTTETGLNTTPTSPAGVIANVAVCAVPFCSWAVIVALVAALTPWVDTVKVPDVWPAATFTAVGTLAAEVSLLASETCAPFGPAGPLSETVPVELFPPTTLVGLSATEFRVA